MKTTISTLTTFVIFAMCAFTMTVSAVELSGYNASNFISVNAMHRSGAPSADELVEVFHNEVSFAPIAGVDTYSINRNDETVAIIENNNGIYTVKSIGEDGNFAAAGAVAMKNGVLTFVDMVSDAPVNPGEDSMNADTVYGDVYSVSFEANGKTYECEEDYATYEGSSCELVLSASVMAAGYCEDGSFGVSIAWSKNVDTDDVKDVEMYEVYRNAGDGWEMIATTTGAYYLDTYNESRAARLQYYVKAIVGGAEKNSQVIGVMYGGQTGIDEIAASEAGMKIKAYPNPATDYITVEGAEGNLTIYSMNGVAMTSVRVAEGEIATLDVTSLSNGMYILKTEKQEAVKILVK